jgi:hypothetical protein
MNALFDMIDSAMKAVRSLKRHNPSVANELRDSVLEMKAAIKEADGE